MDFDRLCAELETNAQTIRALVSGISQAEAQVKPAPDSWSILEVICHLYEEEIEDFPPRLDIILHHTDQPFAAYDSEAQVAERDCNQQDLSEMLEKFLAARARSLEWVRGLSGATWDIPYTTPWRTMTAGDMFTSWVAHDTLHMRQLVELRHALIVSLSEPHSTDYAGDW